MPHATGYIPLMAGLWAGLLALSLPSPLAAQSVQGAPLTPAALAEEKALVDTLRICLIQRVNIAHQGERFPDLVDMAKDTLALWESTWGTAEKVLGQKLDNLMAGGWPAERAHMEANLKKATALVNADNTRDVAAQYLLTMQANLRAGKSPPGTELLASVTPAGSSNPHLAEFMSGKTQMYATPEGAKLDMTLSLRLPASWKGGSGSEPGDLQLWQAPSADGNGGVNCLLAVARLEQTPDAALRAKYYSQEFVTAMLKAQQRKALSYSTGEHMGHVLGVARYRIPAQQETPGGGYGLHYHIVFKKKVIFLDFTTMSTLSESDAAERMQLLEPLAGKILESLWINP